MQVLLLKNIEEPFDCTATQQQPQRFTLKRWLVEGFSFFSLQSKVGRSELLNYFTRNGSNFNYRNLYIDEESKAIAWHNWDRQFVPDKDMMSEYSPTIKVV